MEINKKLTIQKLKKYLIDKQVTGYVWYINEQYPQVFLKNLKITWNDNSEAKNQIQEAYLSCKDESENSVSIRVVNSDGEEHCFVYEESFFDKKKDLKEKDLIKDKLYIANKIIQYPSHIKDKDENKIEYLNFKQVYQLTESVSGADFKTWQPVLQFFTGLTLTSKS